MVRKRILFILLCCEIIFLSACIGPNARLDAGIKSFKQQNYRDAFVRLLPIAKRGNLDAQYAVGYMYYYGQGVVPDKRKAIHWIREAAKAGQPDAQAALDIIHNKPPSPYRLSADPKKRPL